jgi:exodeoxyribonuclease VII large subunit
MLLRLRRAETAICTMDLQAALKLDHMRIDALSDQAWHSMEELLSVKQRDLAEQAARLEMLSPLRVLSRGYVVAKDEAGHLVTRAAGLEKGDRLKLVFSDKEIGCEITQTE